MKPEDNSLESGYEASTYNSSLESRKQVLEDPKIPFKGRRLNMSLFRFNKVAAILTISAVILILLVGGIALAYDKLHHNKAANLNSQESSGNYKIGSNLSVQQANDSQLLTTGQVNNLTINGQLTVNKSLVLTPSSAPTSPIAGEIYIDQSNDQPYYYNGSQFVSLISSSTSQKYVTSIGGISGSVSVGNGLQVTSNGQLSLSSAALQSLSSPAATGVVSLQGKTGIVTLSAGNGIGINGTTITNQGVISLLAGTTNLVVSQDGSGNYTLSDNSVVNSGGVGDIALITGSQTISGSILSQNSNTLVDSGSLTVTGDLNTNNLEQTAPGNNLNISAGNDDLILTANGLTFEFPTTGPAEQTICTTAINCASGGGQAVILQPGSAQTDNGSSSSIYINNTGGGNLIELQGSGDDEFVVGNTGDTTVGGSLTVDSNSIVDGYITTQGTLTVQGSGGITVGSTTNNGVLNFLDGTSDGFGASIELNGALTANETYDLPNTGGTICLSTGNCAGTGGGITGSGTSGDLAVFTGSGTIGNSTELNESGTTVTDSGNLVIQGNDSLTLGTASSKNGSLIFNNSTNAYTTILQTGVPSGSSDLTFTLPTSTGSANQCLVTDGSGVLSFANCLSGGSGGSGGVTSLNGLSGVLSVADATGSGSDITIQDASTSALGLSSFNSSYFNVSSGEVSLANSGVTAGTYGGSSTGVGVLTVNAEGQVILASTTTLANSALANSSVTIDDGTNLTGGAAVSLGSSITLGVSSSPTFSGTLTVQGSGGITVGSTTNNGVLNFLDGTSDGFGASIELDGALTANETYDLPNTGGTICLNTGNCAGTGGGITGSGTSGDLAVFTGSGTIGNSTELNESGTTVTDSGNLVIQGNDSLTLGTASSKNGSLIFNNSTNAYTTILQTGVPSGSSDLTFTLPTSTGSANQCLVTDGSGVLSFANCLSGGSGGSGGVTSLNGLSGVLSVADATGSGSDITIQDASTSALGLSSFNSSYFNVSSGEVSLANSGVTAGTYGGSSTGVGVLTVNAEGQVILASTTTLANSALQNSSVTIDDGTNLTGGAAVSLGSSITLGVSSSPTFSGTLTVSTIDSQASTDLTISAGSSNAIDFIADGRTFILPTTGATDQTICTTGITCASGGGQAVILQPGSAQTDNGSSSSIYINNTGGGNLIELQGSGDDEFVVGNTGDTTVGGSLTVGTVGGVNGVLNLSNSSNSDLSQLESIAPTGTGNATYVLPSLPGGDSDTICLKNLSNCGGTAAITGSGTSGDLAVFTGSGTIGNSTELNESGTTVTDSGNLVIQGNNSLTLGTASSKNGSLIFNNSTNAYTTILQTGVPSGSSDLTFTLPTSTGSANQCLVTDGSGVLSFANCLSGGSGGSGGVTSLNGLSGVLSVADATGSGSDITIQDASTSALGLSSFNSSYFNVSSGEVSLANSGVTAGTYGGSSTGVGVLTVNAEGQVILASTTTLANSALQNSSVTIDDGTNLTGGAAVSLGSSITLGVSSSPTFSGTLTVQGSGGITVGSTTNNGVLNFLDGTSDGFGASIELNGALTANETYDLPNTGGTICLSTGNCAGTGGGITGSGTSGDLAVFTGSGTIGNSTELNESGTTVTDSGNLVIQGNDSLTLGTASSKNGSLIFNNSTNAYTTILQTGVPSGSSDLTFTLPTSTGSANQCLVTDGSGVLSFANCLSGGSGGSGGVTSLNGLSGVLSVADATGSGSDITIQDASTSALGLSSFNSSYFNVSSGEVSLANSGVTAGTYGGSSTGVGVLTVNAEGQVILASTTTLANSALANSSVTIDDGTNLTGGAAVSLGSSITLGVSSSPTFSGTLTVQGSGGITVGSTTNNGVLNFLDGTSDGFGASIELDGALTANETYDLPNTGGTICLNTGNCAGTGGGITGSGTSGDLAVFTGSGTIGNSTELNESGTTVTDSGNLVIQGLGTNGNSVLCYNSSDEISSCGSSEGDGDYIFNQTTQQSSANIDIQGRASSVAAQIQGASGQNIINLYSSSNPTSPVAYFDQNGDLVVASGDTINGATITGGTLSGSTLSSTGLTFSGSTDSITGPSGSTITLDTTGSATLDLGNTHATTINLGNSSSTTSINGSGVTVQAGTGNLALSTGTSTGNVTLTTSNTASGIIAKSSTNSTVAFQIQNASAVDLFQVDTSGDNIYLGGNTTSTVDIGSVGTEAYASTVKIGNSSGAAQTVSIGSTDGTSSLTLQGGSGNLALSTGTSTGNITLTTDNTSSSIIAKSSTNSTVAFQIQNSSGVSILTGDTSDGRIDIGTLGTPTGQLYVSGSIPSSAYDSISASDAGGFATQGDYAYLTSGTEFQVVNISNQLYTGGLATVGSYTSSSYYFNAVTVSGDYAYVSVISQSTNYGAGIMIFNISNPDSPTLLTPSPLAIGVDWPINTMVVSGKYLYVTQDNSGSGTSTVYIYDISNPTDPVLVSSSISLPTANSQYVQQRTMAIVGQYLYIVVPNDDEMVIVNISNPASPTTVSTTSLPTNSYPSSIAISGDLAYIAEPYGSGSTAYMQVYNIANPASPAQVTSGSGVSIGASNSNCGYFNTSDVYLQDNYAYVLNCDSNEINVLNIANPASPTSVGTTSTGSGSGPSEIYVQGLYAYVLDYATGSFVMYNVGGEYSQQLQAGGIETGTLEVDDNGSIGGDLNVQGGLNVGTNAEIAGNLGVGGSVTLQDSTNSTTAFQVQNATDTSLIQVDTSGNNVYLGDNSSGTGTNGTTVNIGSIGTDSYTSTINVGTSSEANQTVTVGSTSSGSTLTLQAGGGITANDTITQAVSGSSGTVSLLGQTATNTNISASSSTVNADSITLTGTTNSHSGENVLKGINFNNVTAATNNTFYGIYFGTGYSSILQYGSTQLISGTGMVQSAAISGTYGSLTGTGTLTTGSIASGFGTINVGSNSIQGGTVTGTSGLYTGAASSATGEIVLYNSSNAYTVTLESGVSSGTYTLYLPTAAASSTGECLEDTTSTSQLGFASCGISGGHSANLVLNAEYIGAALDSASDTSCSSNNIGTMTSGYSGSASTPPQNYYEWTTSQSSTECYDIVVQVPLPSDFGSFPTTGNTFQIYATNSSSANNTSVEVEPVECSGSADPDFGSGYVGISSSTSWGQTTVSGSSDYLTTSGYTSCGYVTLKIRLTASTGSTVQVGTIDIPYTTSSTNN